MLLALIRKEFLVLSRDIHGLAALFVLPVIFIVLMSMALKDVYSPHIEKLTWSVLDEDKTPLSTELITRWEQDNGQPVPLPANWELKLRQGQLKYVIRIAAGAEQDLSSAEKILQPHITLQADPAIDISAYSALAAKIQA